ncbi:hypothetical protein [Ramlibacter sp. AN1133]|uniref:hypothetical protein n=1 Tax=Ramlibacter sp. AN1133 TaxID=3133429 RepID=UPI00404073C4
MVGFAAFSDIAIGIALVLGICMRFSGIAAAAVLAIASYAFVAVKGMAGRGTRAASNTTCSGRRAACWSRLTPGRSTRRTPARRAGTACAPRTPEARSPRRPGRPMGALVVSARGRARP